MLIPSFKPVFDAMDKVKQRLERTTRALESASIEYAVIGGNAVAAWVCTIDPGAVRHTRDVDIMIRRADIDRVIEVMEAAGFTAHKMRSF
jgi:predicted homoserine dehydrogenase-like protein